MREPIKITKYFGITYPSFLGKGIFEKLWRRYMCKRNIHLFDECLSLNSHKLCCDVCQLYVEIKYIDISYVNVDITNLKRLETEDLETLA